MDLSKYNPKTWRKHFRTAIPWSQFQLNIFDKCSNLTEHLAIEAVAGSGKTSSIFGVVAALPIANIQVLAFNRSVMETIKYSEVIPLSRVTVSTFHSCGKAMLRDYFMGQELNVKKNKSNKLAKQAIQELLLAVSDHNTPASGIIYDVAPPQLNEVGLEIFKNTIEKLYNFARLTLTDWKPEALVKMAKQFNIKLPDRKESLWWLLYLTISCLTEGERLAQEERIVDIDDYLFLPNHWGLIPRGVKKYCIGDEAQDSNAGMIGIYNKFVEQGAKLILVGDSAQAIMGFAGADSYSFQTLKSTFQTSELPLSVCYRCATSHLELARLFVPAITARENAPTGIVEVVSQTKIPELAQAADLIICRFKAPLVSVCLNLIVAGKPARVRGRDIGASLISLVETAVKSVKGDCTLNDFKNVFEDYCAKSIAQLKETSDAEEIESLEDRALAVRYCYETFRAECRDFQEFFEKIESLFVEDEDKKFIMLSTIHSAKGSEAENVFILNCDALPYYRDDHLPWQSKQEENLTYVALTRGKENLYLVPRSDNLLEVPLGGMNLSELISQNPEAEAEATQQETKEQEEIPDADLIFSVADLLSYCNSVEQLKELREAFPPKVLKSASRHISTEQKALIKSWVMTLNSTQNLLPSSKH